MGIATSRTVTVSKRGLNEMTNEDAVKIGEISGWIPDNDPMSGTLYWYDKENEEGLVVYATPNWNKDNVVPVAVADEDGKYTNIADLRLVGPLENQIEMYITVVSLAIKQVLKGYVS